MNILEQVNQFRNYGCQMVPVQKDSKKPCTQFVNGSHRWKGIEWPDDEYIKTGAAGINHRDSNMIDYDFDDESAYPFTKLLPQDTLIIGKKVNGVVVPTHYIYSVDDTLKRKKKSLLADRYKPESVVIEQLTDTQTVVLGNDRIIINNVSPKHLTQQEYDNVYKTFHKIGLLAMLTKYYPASGGRDEYCLRVAGCLVRKTFKEWNTYERESLMEELCIANNDAQDLKNRVSKIRYQEEQYKANPDNVAGIKSFSEHINVELPISGNWWNWIGSEELKETTPITALTLDRFVQKNYPPKEYLMYPFLAKGTIHQWWALPGKGKTLLGAHLAVCIAGNRSFLKYTLPAKSSTWPVLYVEGEMSATELQNRFTNELNPWTEENINNPNAEGFPYENLYIAPVREQMNGCFDVLNAELGQKRLELMAEQISISTGKKPVIFLDNVSCLTNMKQNDQNDWNSFMTWLINLRNKDYTIIFFHHATKAGDSSSGSNMKERSVDVELKLDSPDPKERKKGVRGTQIKLTFMKWREFDFTEHSQSIVAVCDRDTGKWDYYKPTKKTKKRLAVEYWLENGYESYDEEAMKKHDEYPISQSQFYKILEKIKEEKKEEDKRSHF